MKCRVVYGLIYFVFSLSLMNCVVGNENIKHDIDIIDEKGNDVRDEDLDVDFGPITDGLTMYKIMRFGCEKPVSMQAGVDAFNASLDETIELGRSGESVTGTIFENTLIKNYKSVPPAPAIAGMFIVSQMSSIVVEELNKHGERSDITKVLDLMAFEKYYYSTQFILYIIKYIDIAIEKYMEEMGDEIDSPIGVKIGIDIAKWLVFKPTMKEYVGKMALTIIENVMPIDVFGYIVCEQAKSGQVPWEFYLRYFHKNSPFYLKSFSDSDSDERNTKSINCLGKKKDEICDMWEVLTLHGADVADAISKMEYKEDAVFEAKVVSSVRSQEIRNPRRILEADILKELVLEMAERNTDYVMKMIEERHDYEGILSRQQIRQVIQQIMGYDSQARDAGRLIADLTDLGFIVKDNFRIKETKWWRIGYGVLESDELTWKFIADRVDDFNNFMWAKIDRQISDFRKEEKKRQIPKVINEISIGEVYFDSCQWNAISAYSIEGKVVISTDLNDVARKLIEKVIEIKSKLSNDEYLQVFIMGYTDTANDIDCSTERGEKLNMLDLSGKRASKVNDNVIIYLRGMGIVVIPSGLGAQNARFPGVKTNDPNALYDRRVEIKARIIKRLSPEAN